VGLGITYFQSDHSGLKSVITGTEGYKLEVGNFGIPCPCPRGRLAWAPERIEGWDVVSAIILMSELAQVKP